MTPRIKEPVSEADLSWFSSELLNQVQNRPNKYQLTGLGPLFNLLHPALIKCRYTFEHSSEDLTFRSNSSAWHLVSYKNQQEAEASVKGVKRYQGHPWQVYRFLEGNTLEAIIHFDQIGSVHLSKSELVQNLFGSFQLHHHALPIWLDYALSTELWGPSGKWTRFHGRLHTLFDNYGLLIEQDFPGYYPLKKEAQWLSKYGFQGNLTQTNYDLILTWDFPLSGLVELEKVISRGP